MVLARCPFFSSEVLDTHVLVRHKASDFSSKQRDSTTTRIRTVSLANAISLRLLRCPWCESACGCRRPATLAAWGSCELPRRVTKGEPACGASFSLRKDRKSTRLNSSHDQISYAVFCLK